MITILTPQTPALATVDDAGVSVGGQVELAVMFAILQAVAAAMIHGPMPLMATVVWADEAGTRGS